MLERVLELPHVGAPGDSLELGHGVAVRFIGTPDGVCAELEDGGFAILYREVIPPADADECADLVVHAR